MIRTPTRRQLRAALQRDCLPEEQIERVMTECRLIDVFGRPALHLAPSRDGRHPQHRIATLSADAGYRRWSIGTINRLDTIDPKAPVLEFSK